MCDRKIQERLIRQGRRVRLNPSGECGAHERAKTLPRSAVSLTERKTFARIGDLWALTLAGRKPRDSGTAEPTSRPVNVSAAAFLRDRVLFPGRADPLVVMRTLLGLLRVP